MSPATTPLIIPVESQVRELDPKLLLACVAAERGYSVVLGSRRQIGFRVASFPRSLYVAKSMTARSIGMFELLRKLGHEIVVWDEEALVHHANEQYFGRRLTPLTLRHVSTLLAWGEENAELFRKYPDYSGTPIHITGNPRGDLIRADVRGYFDEEAERLRDRFGDFVLINTSFSMVNGFLPSMNLLNRGTAPGDAVRPGTASRGLAPAFAAGWSAHKATLFEHFKQLIPALSRAFPDRTIVVRPHPVENHDTWREIARPHDNVHVLHEGSVIPWLLAAKAVIHNGCTTAIEAFAIGLPAIAFRPVTSCDFDFELPDSLSHECFDFGELRETLARILSGELGSPQSPDRQRLLAHHMAGLDGRLACDRIVDVFDEITAGRSLPWPGIASVLSGRIGVTKRRLRKRYVKSRKPGHRNKPEFQRQVFAGVTQEEIETRIGRFARLLGRFEGVRVRQLSRNIFRLQA